MDRPQLVHIGHHVIPNALAQEMKVYAFQHDGYWHVSAAGLASASLLGEQVVQCVGWIHCRLPAGQGNGALQPVRAVCPFP